MSHISSALVIIKPDTIKRKLIGRVLQRIEDKGLSIVRMEMRTISIEEAEELYEEHKRKKWFKEQVEFMTSHCSILMAVEGDGRDYETCMVIRQMMGEYGPYAAPGTIRGDFGLDVRKNLIHCSDSPLAAEKEIEIFFGE